jgi:hypothetical protein
MVPCIYSSRNVFGRCAAAIEHRTSTVFTRTLGPKLLRLLDHHRHRLPLDPLKPQLRKESFRCVREEIPFPYALQARMRQHQSVELCPNPSPAMVRIDRKRPKQPRAAMDFTPGCPDDNSLLDSYDKMRQVRRDPLRLEPAPNEQVSNGFFVAGLSKPKLESRHPPLTLFLSPVHKP